ncbi:MAG: DUF4279 domain-containing protein [Thermoanaerobaculia bacterium]|nr:DUF4279 domain-containing protein [Thermoanaerobaculia bacterium]
MTEDRDNVLSFRSGHQRNPVEPEKPHSFYSATLRVFGDHLDLNAITSALGIAPTDHHHKGERKGPSSPPYEHDMWCLDAPASAEEPLGRHLSRLYETLESKLDYLISLKASATVEISCGCRSKDPTAGFSVEHQALRIFEALDIPCDISMTVLDDE